MKTILISLIILFTLQSKGQNYDTTKVIVEYIDTVSRDGIIRWSYVYEVREWYMTQRAIDNSITSEGTWYPIYSMVEDKRYKHIKYLQLDKRELPKRIMITKTINRL